MRGEPPYVGDERTMLTNWLEYHRATLLFKCEGLDDDQLKTASAPPSALTLLGLVRHLADVERSWFIRGVGQQDAPPLFYTDDNPDGDLLDLASADVAEALAALAAETDRARAVMASVGTLDQTFFRPGRGDVSARWVMMHMIEEYARHNGHADLIRERIDGATGE